MILNLNWQVPDNGSEQEQTVELPITIGRATETNDVVIQHESVSRHHARLALVNDRVTIIDQNSVNGIVIAGQRKHQAVLASGSSFNIGAVTITVRYEVNPIGSHATTVLFEPEIAAPPAEDSLDIQLQTTLMPSQFISARESEFPPQEFQRSYVSMWNLRLMGFPIEETTFVAIGGGLGSFSWVDHLVVYGADPGQIVSIGFEEKPYGRYQRLCRNSQIPDHERLRSNSDSCPDNLWGWPGYAVREIWSDIKQGKFRDASRVARQIFAEPYLSQTYTPQSGDVFQSIDREATRIGWDRIWRYGRVKAIRKTDDGRYAIAYSQSNDHSRVHRFIVAPYVHIAIGYPALRFLPDLQAYRAQTGDFKSVVNAYEDHEHVYEQLRRQGGVVLLRGRGIVSSRILQRLYEVRRQNAKVAVLHLNRSPLEQGFSYGRAQRGVGNHWEFQPFNWPKATWGGDLQVILEKASDSERKQLLQQLGGTTTADRTDWVGIVNSGLREGWYQIRFGQVKGVTKGKSGCLETTIRGKGVIQDETTLTADFIIDATGLEAKVSSHPLLRDMLDTYQLRHNAHGGLFINNDFQLVGMENQTGCLYASGSMTLGGPYAPVDTFLGLQYAAIRSVDHLTAQGAPGLRRLQGWRSVRQWLRWTRGVKP